MFQLKISIYNCTAAKQSLTVSRVFEKDFFNDITTPKVIQVTFTLPILVLLHPIVKYLIFKIVFG